MLVAAGVPAALAGGRVVIIVNADQGLQGASGT
jgi:hypothetical protein